MLSYDELLGQVKHLTPEEQVALIEATAQMVKDDLLEREIRQSQSSQASMQVSNKAQDEYVPFIREDWLNLDEEALRAKGIELRGTPFESILGIGLSGENGHVPTDEELKDDYINYLIEKYVNESFTR